jgi:hypothetical protein
MSDGASTGPDQSRTLGQKVKRGVESKVLVPIAATIVSAATSYLIKKLPLIIEEKVLPKLREQSDAGGVRRTVAETADVVDEQPSHGAPDASGRISEGADQADGAASSSVATGEREQERREREERRRERRRALQRT